MSDKTAIEWTDATWNPIRGCSRVSEGCRFCYAERVAARFSGKGQAYEGLAEMTAAGPRWTGKIKLVNVLDPLRWRQPRRIFVNSMSDLFHEKVSDEWIDLIFGVIVRCPQHVFQVLTKRPERMFTYMNRPKILRGRHDRSLGDYEGKWPPSNIWLGTSCEDQPTADERIPWLLKTPAAIRFVSLEPLLGPITLEAWLHRGFEAGPLKEPRPGAIGMNPYPAARLTAGLDWIICGGESGGPPERALVEKLYHAGYDKSVGEWVPKPEALEWVGRIRDQCRAAGVAFFHKQWGGPTPKSGGRLLDGREWNEYPT